MRLLVRLVIIAGALLLIFWVLSYLFTGVKPCPIEMCL